MPYFLHEDRKIAYEVHGEGDRPLVLIHGLLLNRRMFARLAPAMAARGNRVITVDLLGHGASDRPAETVNYAMAFFGQQVVGLLDHLEIEQAVIGGTSLGANTTLTVAKDAPERVKGMMVEMPVLDNALVAVAAIFTPILVGLRFAGPALERLAALARRIPRTNYMLDIGLDLVRQDPAPSAAVLEGLFLGAGAPHHNERVRMKQPAMVIGHRGDLIHPISDSGMLAEELPNSRLVEANSIFEWRISPRRLDDELARFLDDVWGGAAVDGRPEAALRQSR